VKIGEVQHRTQVRCSGIHKKIIEFSMDHRVHISFSSSIHLSHTDRGVVYYEVRKRELNRRLIYECRCDERLGLKGKGEGSTRLVDTGLCGGIQHPKDCLL
jgi:hypothetical protein